MIKKDWSIIRITVLLYFIVVLLPVNYYFAKQSFESMQNDATTMNHLVYISGALPNLSSVSDLNKRDAIVKKINSSLKTIENTFIHFPPNKEYVALFKADKIYALLKKSYEELKVSLNNQASLQTCSSKTFAEVSNFSKITKEMMTYKINTILDRLYLSLAFTMISIIVLIFFVRLYIKLQILKHAIHDHVTGLYNKKYFDNVLQNSELLETRQGKPLSLLILSIANYKELQNSLNDKAFDDMLKEFTIKFSHFFRQSDTVARIKENYFASIAPDATSVNINKLSNRLLQELQAKYLDKNININICIGVATYNKESSVSLLDEAMTNLNNSDTCTIGGAL